LTLRHRRRLQRTDRGRQRADQGGEASRAARL